MFQFFFKKICIILVILSFLNNQKSLVIMMLDSWMLHLRLYIQIEYDIGRVGLTDRCRLLRSCDSIVFQEKTRGWFLLGGVLIIVWDWQEYLLIYLEWWQILLWFVSNFFISDGACIVQIINILQMISILFHLDGPALDCISIF